MSIHRPGEVEFIDPQADDAALTNVYTDEQKKLRTLITRRHPKYDRSKEHWKFLESTYEGGRDWFKKHLFRYIKEGEQEFTDRIDRAYRFNHTREVVDLINKYLFKQYIARSEDAPTCVKEFWEKTTKNGLSITDFARQVSKTTSMLGRVGIIVDTNKPAGANLSKAEAKAAGVMTYAYMVTPNQLLDYAYDEDGGLSWVLIHEIAREDEDPFTSSGKEVDRYRLWTKTGWKLFEERMEGRRKVIATIDEAAYDIGEVPVILADNLISDEEYYVPALIDDIAYLDRAVANYLSNMDAIIQDQTFSQLAMPAQNVMPGEDNYSKMVEMGTKRTFLYDGESGTAPFYLSPDIKQAQLILDAINKIINEIYHTVGLGGERTKQDNSVGIDNSSGVAKAFDFERVSALLSAKADSLGTIENKIVRLVALWNGETIEDDLVSYPENFDTRGLYDEFDIAARLMLIDAPEAVRQEQMGTVLDKLFPQLDAKTRKKMDTELKDWPVDPIELATQLQEVNNSAIGSKATIKSAPPATGAPAGPKAPTTPTAAGGAGKKSPRDKKQGQVTKETK